MRPYTNKYGDKDVAFDGEVLRTHVTCGNLISQVLSWPSIIGLSNETMCFTPASARPVDVG